MSKKELLKQVRGDGGSFIFLSHPKSKTLKRIGYVTSEKSLMSHIASYASRVGATEIEVFGGRNIMDEDGPKAVFSVSVTIS